MLLLLDVLGNNVNLLAGLGHDALRSLSLVILFADVVKFALLSSSSSTRSSSSSYLKMASPFLQGRSQ